MNGLISFATVDGFNPGKITELQVRNNSSFHGMNASGKTTLISIPSLFFGSKPSDIKRAAEGNTLSFTQFYLPRPTSYIVFSYEANSAPKTVLVFNQMDSVKFLLVDAQFNRKWLIDENGYFVPNNALIRQIQHVSPEAYISGTLGVADYQQAVLHPTTARPRLVSSKKAKEITALRSRFSIAIKGRNLSSIGDMVIAILNQTPSLNSIKDMLENILLEGNASNDTLNTRINSEEINELINNFSAYQNIESQAQSIIDLAEAKSHCDELTNRLSHLALSIRSKLKHTQREQKLFSDLVTQEQKLLEDVINDRSQASSKFKADIRPIKTEIDDTQSKLEKLISVKEYYEKNNIPKQRSAAESLPALIARQNDIQNIINDIKLGIKEISGIYDQKRQSLNTERNETKNQHKQLLASLKTQLTDKLHSLELSTNKERTRLLENHQLFTSNVHKAITELSKSIGKLESKLENPPAPKELTDELSSLQSEETTTRHDMSLDEKELKKTKEEKAHKENERNDLLKELSKLQNNLTSLESKRDKLLEQHNPAKGSLLSFLRNNVPDHETNIAKVINPELLNLTTLNPSYEPENQSLYGLNLDLTFVDTPTFASLDALQEELNAIDAEIISQTKAIETTTSEIDTATKVIKSINSHISRIDISIRQQNSVLNDINAKRSSLNNEIKARAIEYKKRMTEELEVLKEQAFEQNLKLKNAEKELKKNKETLTESHSQKRKEIEDAHTLSTERASKSFNQKLKTIEANLQAIEDEEKQALKSNGINTDTVHKEQQRLVEIKKAISDASRDQASVEAYDKFIENEWPNHEYLEAELSKLQEKLGDITSSFNTLVDSLDESERRLLNNIEKNTKLSNNARKDADKLQELDNSTASYLSHEHTSDEQSVYNVEFLTEQVLSIKDDFSKTDTQATKYFKQIADIFNKNSSSPKRFFTRLNSEVGYSFDAEGRKLLDTGRWYEFADPLNEWLTDSMPNEVQSLSNQANIIMTSVEKFFDTLKHYNSKIQTIGSALTKESMRIISEFDFRAINELRIQVSSLLTKLEYWDSLKNFTEEYKAWKTRDSDTENLVTLLNNLQSIASITSKTGLNIRISESFHIEIFLNDQGSIRTATTDASLKSISSKGVSYLIIVLIYTAISNQLRGDADINIIWSLDELKELDQLNAKEIIRLVNQYNIFALSAFPEPDAEILQKYENIYIIDSKRQVKNHTREVKTQKTLSDFITQSMGATQ